MYSIRCRWCAPIVYIIIQRILLKKIFPSKKKIKKNSFDARNKHLQAGENAKRKNVMREKFIFNNSCFFGA